MRGKMFFLFIIVILTLLSVSVTALDDSDVQRAAFFYLDYVDYFNVPPKYVIVDEKAFSIVNAYILFAHEIVGREQQFMSIVTEQHDFITTRACEQSTVDIFDATEQLLDFFTDSGELPVAIKLGDCYISNGDFLYLLSKIISDKGLSALKDQYKIKRFFFDHTMEWNAPVQEKYIEFTMDVESDRPVFSDDFIGEIVKSSSVGVNPTYFERRCYGDFCTYPRDYEKGYSSQEVAWVTSVGEEQTFLPCSPYCGVLDGIDILFDEFVEKYGFPVTFHMTGDAIVMFGIHNELRDRVSLLRDEGLIDLGIHTMYHTNMKEVSADFRERTLRENVAVFKEVFGGNPVQYRTPYLALPDGYSSATYLSSYGVLADNEVAEAYGVCYASTVCNYDFVDEDVAFVRLDWFPHLNDKLLNIYLSHPWELLFREIENPVFLVEDTEAKHDVFKKWLYLVGEHGVVPTTPTKVLQ